MTAPFTIRPVTEDEFAVWANTTERPFFEEVGEARLARWRRVTEIERSLAALDGDRIVGGSLLFRIQLTVPGGELAMGGLTAVGVLPTHRRRGILTALMQRHLEDLRDWGEPLSGLYAAEAPIYGRYGYGVAAPSMFWTIDQRLSAFRAGVPTDGDIVLLDPQEAFTAFPPIYDAVRTQRPGMPDRQEPEWHNFLLEDPPEYRDGFSAKHLARLGDRGYVVYRATSGDWPNEMPEGKLKVVEHMAVDTAAAAALWRFVFDHDLIRTISMSYRPTDDVLPLLLANPRALTGWRHDSLYLRLVDVPTALAGRRYSAEDTVTLRVHDSQLDGNTGTWRLDAGPDGAACTRTTGEPDLTMTAEEAAMCYLGATRLTTLVRAGRVEEGTVGAAERADALFATDPAPWCPQEF